MQTRQLGLAAWMCWSCGAPANPDDDLYDIPVAAPSLGGWQGGQPSPAAEDGLDVDGPSPVGSGAGEREPEIDGRSLRAMTAAGELSEAELYEVLAEARVVCFGETHDEPAHHVAQTRAADELAARTFAAGTPFALGFEMFQTPFQSVLTGFTLGSLDERELLSGSQYALRWGYDFALYRPLLELAREYRLPALALNAPAELTRKVADVGLDGLSAEERDSLPDLDLNDAEHRAYVSELLGAFHSGAVAPEPAAFDNPYAVQVLWDETMAETASNWVSSSGEGARLLIIAGLGHCHDSAIPSRITRRTGLPVLAVAPVLESRLGTPGFPTLERYDVLVVIGD